MVHLSGITKQYGNKILFKGASFQINAGEKIGLVGPNGAGKTTIFRVIVDEEGVDEGRVSKPDKVKIGYFSQNIEEMKGRSAIEEVISAVGNIPKLKERLQELEAKLCEVLDEKEMERVLEEYGNKQAEFEGVGGYEIESRASEILTGLGIHPEDHQKLTESFSGGWKMRIALAKILAIQPDVLLMDEPTNHLDLESIIWLEEWLVNFKGSILMTSHDRDFMNRLVTKIVEVANKSITVYSGNYDFYEKEKEIRKEQLIASAKRQEDMLAKEEEFIARFAARASHAAQVQSRVKKLEKIDRIEIPAEEKEVKVDWPVPPRGGDEVLKFENLGKSWLESSNNKDFSSNSSNSNDSDKTVYSEELANSTNASSSTKVGIREKLVFKGANALVKRLDRVAVVGVNGAGKSTLLKIISGQAVPTEGNYNIGASIEIGYFSQNSLDVLDPKLTILEELQSRVPNSSIGYIRNLLGAMKFSGEDADKKIAYLSGGEKSRVVLATILSRPVNFLVLDEPTNHLDIVSREVLLQAIKDFPGTVMIVSHDRHFLREITTRVFELDKHKLTVTDGPWDYYVSKRQSLTHSGSTR